MYAKRSFLTVLKDIGLFFAAPFIALAYLALFPYYAVLAVMEARKAGRTNSPVH